MSALSANLGPSLDLLANIVQRPTFAAGRGRPGSRPGADGHFPSAKGPPAALRRAILPTLLYGENHPYGDDGPWRAPPRLRASLATIWRASTSSGFAPTICGSSWCRACRSLSCSRCSTSAFGIVDRTRRRRRAQKSFGAIPPRPSSERIVLVDRPGFAAIDDLCRRGHAARSAQRRGPGQHRQRRARRQFPVADQHRPQGNQGLDLRHVAAPCR